MKRLAGLAECNAEMEVTAQETVGTGVRCRAHCTADTRGAARWNRGREHCVAVYLISVLVQASCH